MEYGLVLANGAIAILAFVYIHQRSQSAASLYWAAGWVVLLTAGVLQGLPGPPLWARILVHATGVALALLFLTGALAFVGRRVPSWLLPLGLVGACTSALAPVLTSSSTAYILAPVFEVPAVLAAAWVLGRRGSNDTLPQRLLGPAFVVLAVLDTADGFARAAGVDGLSIALVWVGVLVLLGLAQLAALLEQGFERERQLAEDLDRARKLEALGRLAGGLAHDLSNQLTVIVGNAALLRDGSPLDEDSQTSLDELERSALRCADRARDILAFARESGSEPQPVDVAAVVQDLGRTFIRTLPDDVEYDTQIQAKIPFALADPNQLRRVLSHLLQNARDAVGSRGAIVLRVGADDHGRNNGFHAPDGPVPWVWIEVQDDGSGMDQETQEHIFDPFFTTRPGMGAGVGLSIVYGVVRAHGGSIEVESQPGAGTTFRIRWPGAPAGARTPASRPAFRHDAANRAMPPGAVALVHDPERG